MYIESSKYRDNARTIGLPPMDLELFEVIQFLISFGKVRVWK